MAPSTALGSVFDVESFINEYYDAWGGTDEDRIMSYYAENVVLQIPGTLMEGKEALRDQFVRPFITAFPGNRHLVKNMIFGPGVVLVEFSFEAQHKGPFAGHVATGARVKVPGCGVYEYDSARRQITAGRIYFDMGTLLQIITDTLVDDRKKAEEALQSNDRNLSLIANAIPTLIHVLRTDGSVLYVNQAVLAYTGLTLEDVRKDDYRARFFHPEDVERLREERREALRRALPFENEQRVLGKDGVYRWFQIRYNPLLDEQGRIDRWYAAAFDIEERKRAEAQVEQAYLRLAEAQRLSKTGSFITDLLVDDHNWSEELYRIFEFDPATRITHEAIRTVVHPEDLPIYEAAFKHTVDGLDGDLELTYRIITSAGNVKHVHAVAHVMETVAGRPVFIGAVQDITESKTSQEALTRARSELAHMARVTTLSALTASIAHEINQPIAAVITSAGACLRWLNRDQPEVERARETAMRIEDDGKRAAEIITHLKFFYKKDVSPERELVSVNDVVGEMLVLLRSEADRHSVVMRTDLAADLSSVSADRVQLQQVLMNLMLNGMEAMSERGGELKISTRREGGEVMVSVSDTGVGMPADKMEEIFNAFFTTKAGGTGMGLAISSTIIESHGGRLWATVNPGRGATFHFTLPTEPEAPSDH
jgi:PAS domain S-box-containing protein